MSLKLDQFGIAASAFSIISTACYLTGSQGIAPAVTFVASTILLAKACEPAEKLYQKGVMILLESLFPYEVENWQMKKIEAMFAKLINVIASVVVSVFANEMLLSTGHVAMAFIAKEVAIHGLGGLFLSTVFTGAQVVLTTTSIVAVAGLVFYDLAKNQPAN